MTIAADVDYIEK